MHNELKREEKVFKSNLKDFQINEEPGDTEKRKTIKHNRRQNQSPSNPVNRASRKRSGKRERLHRGAESYHNSKG